MNSHLIFDLSYRKTRCIFFNKNTGKLNFETEIWKTVDNETTFD